ncbi:MAG TPA: GNAT family N-acetyltransferase, partial [Erysipelothrix sp.]
VLDTWNLSGCTLYVTMEPCLMCSGAIKESRIKRVVYGCSDKKGGYLMSNTSISSLFNIEVIPNVLEVEASNILKKYFENKRSNMIKVSKLKFSDLSAYFNLRREVFVEEQGVSHENEFDAYDKTDLFHVEHIAARNNNEVIGTMRLIYDTNHKTIKLGRLAVKKSERNKNIGKRLLDYAERQAKSRGFDTVLLSAQLHALEFYKKNGYREEGTTYIDAGIEHVKMKKSIK